MIGSWLRILQINQLSTLKVCKNCLPSMLTNRATKGKRNIKPKISDFLTADRLQTIIKKLCSLGNWLTIKKNPNFGTVKLTMQQCFMSMRLLFWPIFKSMGEQMCLQQGLYTEFLVKSLEMLLRQVCQGISKYPYFYRNLPVVYTFFATTVSETKENQRYLFYTFIKSCHLFDRNYECCMRIYLINTFLN